MIIDKLISKIKQTSNPTVVGLDPRLEYIPNFIKDEAYKLYGYTPKAASVAIFQFNKFIIDEICDLIPAVKPQIAMYEQFGAEGIDCYIRTIKYAKAKDLIVIGDIKRGDIASTAQAYSDGHIGMVSIGRSMHEIYSEDMITINPYLGFDSVEPYLEDCKNYERGMFVLVKTSNPNSGEIQDLVADGEKIYERVAKLVSKWGKGLIGNNGYSDIGAVVGATYPEQARVLRKLMPETFFLVPGYGAQGAKGKDLANFFNSDGLGAIVNNSRGIIAAHQTEKNRNKYKEQDFAKAAREAVLEMKEDLNRAFSYGVYRTKLRSGKMGKVL